MIKNIVMLVLGMGIGVTVVLASIWVFWLWFSGQVTVSERAKLLPQFWRNVVAAVAGFVMGLILGVIIGHFGWAMT
jgi:hypothetical protein